MALTDGMRVLAKAAKRARGQQIETRRYWATVVAGGTAPTVRLDADPDGVARPVSANATGPVFAGQRVRVEMRGRRLTIEATPTGNTCLADDYGAVGDGITSDTAALNRAVQHSLAHGCTIALSGGKAYRLTSTIDLQGIRLDGRGASVKMDTAGTLRRAFFSSAPPVIENLTIDMQAPATSLPGAGAGTSHLAIHLHSETDWASGAVIRNVTMRNSQTPLVRISTDLTGLTDPANGRVMPTLIENCTLDNAWSGIAVHGAKNVRIRGCTITNTTSDGILCNLTANSQIESCSVSLNGRHGIAGTYASDMSVMGNIAHDTQSAGICIGGGSPSLAPSRNFTVAANRTRRTGLGPSYPGIIIDLTREGAPDAPVDTFGVVSGNSVDVTGSQGHGIYVNRARGVVISGNFILGSSMAGIGIYGRGVTATGNSIVRCAEGFRITGYSTLTTFGQHAIGDNSFTEVAAPYRFENNGAWQTPLRLSGTTDPNGAVTAPVGSTYSRLDNGAQYTKGGNPNAYPTNTGWVQL